MQTESKPRKLALAQSQLLQLRDSVDGGLQIRVVGVPDGRSDDGIPEWATRECDPADYPNHPVFPGDLIQEATIDTFHGIVTISLEQVGTSYDPKAVEHFRSVAEWMGTYKDNPPYDEGVIADGEWRHYWHLCRGTVWNDDELTSWKPSREKLILRKVTRVGIDRTMLKNPFVYILRQPCRSSAEMTLAYRCPFNRDPEDESAEETWKALSAAYSALRDLVATNTDDAPFAGCSRIKIEVGELCSALQLHYITNARGELCGPYDDQLAGQIRSPSSRGKPRSLQQVLNTIDHWLVFIKHRGIGRASPLLGELSPLSAPDRETKRVYSQIIELGFMILEKVRSCKDITDLSFDATKITKLIELCDAQEVPSVISRRSRGGEGDVVIVDEWEFSPLESFSPVLAKPGLNSGECPPLEWINAVVSFWIGSVFGRKEEFWQNATKPNPWRFLETPILRPAIGKLASPLNIDSQTSNVVIASSALVPSPVPPPTPEAGDAIEFDRIDQTLKGSSRVIFRYLRTSPLNRRIDWRTMNEAIGKEDRSIPGTETALYRLKTDLKNMRATFTIHIETGDPQSVRMARTTNDDVDE